jgi:hypothetical protein
MKNPFPLIIIFIVAAFTAWLVNQRITQIAGEDEIDEQGLEQTRRLFTLAFTASAVLFGVVVSVIYNYVQNRWAALAQPLFIIGSSSAMLLFSMAAAIIRPRANVGGVKEVITLNLLWGLGYGWFLPYTLSP